MHLLKSLQKAKHVSSLAKRTIPVGLPARPDAILLRGCVFLGYHGDMKAFLPETWPATKVALLDLHHAQGCCISMSQLGGAATQLFGLCKMRRNMS